jgi:hypothetical protein
MKNVYHVIFALCACLMTFVPQRSLAQCLCSGGVTPNMITYLDTLNPTTAALSNFTFPKFDPMIGTLSCVGFDDTISDLTTTNVWNLDTSGKSQFQFLVAVTHHVNGPGISVNKTGSKNYGPDSLNAAGDSPGDSIVYGPDQFLNKSVNHNFTATTAPYLGASGTVNFTYSLSGGIIELQGPLNYGFNIVTNYWGTFRLTYYWCPVSLLASLMSNFTAARNGNYVQLKWQAQNEQTSIGYEIEYSSDGTEYVPVADLQSTPGSGGNPASYQYMYKITQHNIGQLYFRIKRMSADGKSITYSDIKTVNLTNSAVPGYHVYPNPVRSYTMIEFDEVLSGDYIINLINTTGQIVQQNVVSLAGTNQFRLNLTSHPATGIYYLQVRDKANNHQFISKLIIE